MKTLIFSILLSTLHINTSYIERPRIERVDGCEYVIYKESIIHHATCSNNHKCK